MHKYNFFFSQKLVFTNYIWFELVFKEILLWSIHQTASKESSLEIVGTWAKATGKLLRIRRFDIELIIYLFLSILKKFF